MCIRDRMTSTLLLGCYSAIRQSLAVSVSYIFYWCYGDSKYLVTGMEREAVPLAQLLDTLFILACLLFYYIYGNKYKEEIEKGQIICFIRLVSIDCQHMGTSMF